MHLDFCYPIWRSNRPLPFAPPIYFIAMMNWVNLIQRIIMWHQPKQRTVIEIPQNSQSLAPPILVMTHDPCDMSGHFWKNSSIPSFLVEISSFLTRSEKTVKMTLWNSSFFFKWLEMFSSWWFQPIWKILYSKFGSFPQIGMKIKNISNHHPGSDCLRFLVVVTTPTWSSVILCWEVTWDNLN